MNTHSLYPQDAVTGTSPTRREWLKFSALGLLAPTWLTGCGGSDAPLRYDDTIAAARTSIVQALTDSDTPSISVALVERDRLVWAQAFGTIDKAAGTPVSTDTLFCIGSCSKMLATIAVMILVDRGLVALDEPLMRYLPEFKMASPEYTRVTVRMLISHSSGFPGSDYRGFLGTVPNTAYAAQVMQTLATARLKHLPGEMSTYCNDGFTMVEPLVQRLTGKTYPKFVGDEIPTPLGMSRSRYATDFLAPGSFAPGYDGDVKRPQEFANPYASGGLYTTPSEMASLAQMLLNQGVFAGKRLLSAASVAAMGQDQTVAEPLRPVAMDDGYGLGWDGVRQGGLAAVGVTAWHKGGATATYGSHLFVLPAEGLALMITGTSLAYGADTLAERIMLQALVERRRLSAMPAALTFSARPVVPASDAQLADIVGVYAKYDGLASVEAQADHTVMVSNYVAGAWVQSPYPLKQRDDGSFSSDMAPDMAFLFHTPPQGEHYLLTRLAHGMGHYLVENPHMQRLEPKAPLSAAWQARLGRPWLLVNEPAESVMLKLAPPVLKLAGVPGLPGYILASDGIHSKDNQIADASASDTVAGMCLKIPGAAGRDLDDVVIMTRSGEEWVRVGSSVFRPESSVPALAIGANTVVIGTEGYAEWRTIAASATGQSVTISGADAWKLYDNTFSLQASGDPASQPPVGAGSAQRYILLYGRAGTSIGVTLS